MGALVIPGVQVRTEFEPTPALPSATGILGAVGVTDRGPIEPTPIGSFSEFIEIFGPASRYTMPEVRTALANGVFKAVIARTAPGRGRKAFLQLQDADNEPVVRLEARAEGAWGEQLAVKVNEVRTLAERGVKYVNLEVYFKGEVIERIENLVSDPTSPNYLFSKINSQSSVLIAVDPVFEKGLPQDMTRTPLASSDARAAFTVLRAGPDDVVTVTARRTGRAGNRIAIQVKDGRAGLTLTGAGDAPSVDIRAREPGTGGTAINVSVAAAAEGVNIVITPPGGTSRPIGPNATVAEIVTGLGNDPDVSAVAVGDTLPAVASATALRRRVTIDVIAEGQDTSTYQDRATLEAIGEINDSLARFEPVAGATQLPDSNEGVPLSGGRSRGRALLVSGDVPDQPLVELVPAPRAPESIAVRFSRGISTIDNATAVVNLQIFVNDELTETHSNLTMDPDDPNYLPVVLEESGLLRALDLFVRSRTTSLPRALVRPQPLDEGDSPSADDYRGALERLELAEEVDLVLASLNGQLEDNDIRAVHQAVAAHCAKMANLARTRIGIGSVTASESGSPAAILDHANDVRSDHFVLVAPADTDAAFAGLLGRQTYFHSPTFKTILSPGGQPGNYSDPRLEQLVSGNVLVINKRRKRGIIVIKGILTSGRQVNVQRTVNKAVRDVNAIANNYIGLLNNAGNRNALKQQVFALLAQMERDGALVPSTDGSDPAFKVEVLATQDDSAKGIVRIDLALRPVRAIDFIYVTIFVQN